MVLVGAGNAPMTEMVPGHSMVLFPPQNRPEHHVNFENGSPPRTSTAKSPELIKLGLFALTAALADVPTCDRHAAFAAHKLLTKSQ